MSILRASMAYEWTRRSHNGAPPPYPPRIRCSAEIRSHGQAGGRWRHQWCSFLLSAASFIWHSAARGPALSLPRHASISYTPRSTRTKTGRTARLTGACSPEGYMFSDALANERVVRHCDAAAAATLLLVQWCANTMNTTIL